MTKRYTPKQAPVYLYKLDCMANSGYAKPLLFITYDAAKVAHEIWRSEGYNIGEPEPVMVYSCEKEAREMLESYCDAEEANG